MAKEEPLDFPGAVSEGLQKATFRATIKNDHEIIAHTVGKMRQDCSRAPGAPTCSWNRRPTT